MGIKTKQGFGVNLGLAGLSWSQNSLREITGKVWTMPGGEIYTRVLQIQENFATHNELAVLQELQEIVSGLYYNKQNVIWNGPGITHSFCK